MIIPFETAIALYRLGRFDGGVLANCIPKELAQRECPEILKDIETINFVADMLQELDTQGHEMRSPRSPHVTED